MNKCFSIDQFKWDKFLSLSLSLTPSVCMFYKTDSLCVCVFEYIAPIRAGLRGGTPTPMDEYILKWARIGV